MPKIKEKRGGAHNVKYKNKAERRKGTAKVRKEWTEKNLTFINVRYNLEKDKDILDKLASVPKKVDYLRELVRRDIARDNNKKEEG